jgi:DNA (cytosine-5)-methyltransferase 1
MLYGLDLFSGIGGISIALEPWVKTIAYCERDKYAQSVLLSRMEDGQLDTAPIWDDVKTLDGTQFKGLVDIIFGGFPCQDISCAGAGKGMEGERSWLFTEIMRLAEEARPSFIFLENVSAIRTRGLAAVVRELARIRYDARWGCLSAFDVGAPHKRERWFLLAHDNSIGKLQQKRPIEKLRKRSGDSLEKRNCRGVFLTANEKWESSNSSGARLACCWKGIRASTKEPTPICDMEINDLQEFASELLRVDDGVPNRPHRIRCMGNSVVPIQAREAFKRLMWGEPC